MNISFHYQKKINLLQRTELKAFIPSIFKKEKKPFQALSVIFCSDDYLLQINKSYLQHDYYTDIITFDLSDGVSGSGEIYISTDRVKENAAFFGSSFNKELHRVIFHGILHLCGYKDKTHADQTQMRKMEDLYLSKYFKGST